MASSSKRDGWSGGSWGSAWHGNSWESTSWNSSAQGWKAWNGEDPDQGVGKGQGRTSTRWSRGKPTRGTTSNSAWTAEKNANVDSAVAHGAAPQALDVESLTKLKLVFCPDPGTGCFTTTYETSPSVTCFGSVNAGSGRSLKVGGSGLNGQFEKDLHQAGQPVAKFQHVHSVLMKLAQAKPGELVEAPADVVQKHGGLVGAFACVADADGNGFVAIDILQEGLRPLHAANAAMVYCVGPDRRQYETDVAFLQTLRELGENFVRACGGYNALASSAPASAGLQPLHRVRVALVAGGKYAGRVEKRLVARSILEGMLGGTAHPTTEDCPEFELAYVDNIFKQAWDELQHELGADR